MAGHKSPLWTDRSWLRDVQYRTEANLAARQSLYAYQHPRLNLPARALGLAALTGTEAIADVGCGNGLYLAELARRGHAGRVLGVDLSPGMLQAARDRVPHVGMVAGDAVALPLHDGACDLTMAMAMLDHVPDPRAAVRELRRITRPGGQALVALNGHGHLQELRDAITAALPEAADGQPRAFGGRLRIDAGADLLAGEFATVTRHDFTSELLLPGPEPVEGYIRSMTIIKAVQDPGRLVAAVLRELRHDRDGTIRVRTNTGYLIGR
jgi:SAM-dependent methyltransferase